MYNLSLARDVGWSRFVWRTFRRQLYKRVLKRDIPLRLPTGATVLLPPESSFTSEVVLTNGDVDWGAERIMAKHLGSDGVFLDVGAHFGYYSVYMRPLVAEVHAFEPDRRMIGNLRRNLGRFDRGFLHEVAVGDRSGRVRFTLRKRGELSGLQTEADSDGTAIEVDITTLDDFAEPLGLNVTGIKVDVEGADLQVLMGAKRLIERCQPLILAETRVDAAAFEWARLHHYEIHAAQGERHSRRRAFRRFDKPEEVWTKMIFFVPPRLAGRFRCCNEANV